jgi:DNA repair exonuclease SbcCD nuclease subunit
MRFLHTADWQIGMKAVRVGEVGARVREARLLAVNKVAEIARSHSVEFVLIAGDTFEDNAVDRILIQRVVDLLAGFEIPVYVIPGNHDPLLPGSVWEHPAWKAAANVHVIREEKPLEISGGVLYTCPVKRKHSVVDPTSWISSAGGSPGIRIAIAHGTVEGIQLEEPDYPVPRDAVLRTGLDYLALGHWHSTALYPDGSGVTRMAYSGTHETTKFGERNSGNVLIVNIPAMGQPPEISSVHSGGLTWEQVDEDIRLAGDLRRVREQIEAMKQGESTLINLNLKGLLSADDNDEIIRIRGIMASRFLYGHMDISKLNPSPADESWVANLPVGIIRETGEKLRQLADPAFTGKRTEGVSPELASRALLELYAVAIEVLK